MKFVRRLGLIMGMLALQASPFAIAESEINGVQALLAKMSRVSHNLNYQGTFTYEHQHSFNLQGFKVSHWVVDGIEHERLQYLSGPEREIVRHGQLLDCLPPGDQLLQGKLTYMGAHFASVSDLYQFKLRNTERVAGRLATVLQVVPKDIYRYGYLISVDQETGLILRSMTIDTNGRIIERYQFMELELNPPLEKLASEPDARQQRIANSPMQECNQTEARVPTHWRINWIPPGFAFVGEQVRDAREMLMYSDGMTTFSIFIEPALSAPPEGVGQRGPTVLFMTKAVKGDQLYRVTVVGEIPAAAAEQVAMGIESLLADQIGVTGS